MRVSLVYGLLAILAIFVLQSDAVICSYNRIGHNLENDQLVELNNKSDSYCSGSCIATFIEGDYQETKFSLENGDCEKNGKENFIAAESYQNGKVYKFQCETDKCNKMDTPDYKNTTSLLKAVDKVAELLKTKSNNLKCHDQSGKSIRCTGVCMIERHYVGTTADKTTTSCSPGYQGEEELPEAKDLHGSYGVAVKMAFEKEKKKTMITAYCSKTNCNEKNSLDKEFAEIIESTNSTTEEPNNSIFSSIWFWIVLAVVLLALIGGAVFLFICCRKKKTNKNNKDDDKAPTVKKVEESKDKDGAKTHTPGTEIGGGPAGSVAKDKKAPCTLTVDPPKCILPAKGGTTNHKLINPGKEKLVFKVESSNNQLFRVTPVFGFVEPGGSTPFEIARLAGPPKNDKLVVKFGPASADATDAIATYETIAAAPAGTITLPIAVQ